LQFQRPLYGKIIKKKSGIALKGTPSVLFQGKGCGKYSTLPFLRIRENTAKLYLSLMKVRTLWKPR
jgi:hypothetical protein